MEITIAIKPFKVTIVEKARSRFLKSNLLIAMYLDPEKLNP